MEESPSGYGTALEMLRAQALAGSSPASSARMDSQSFNIAIIPSKVVIDRAIAVSRMLEQREGLFHLGEHGTCRELLCTFELTGGVK